MYVAVAIAKASVVTTTTPRDKRFGKRIRQQWHSQTVGQRAQHFELRQAS